MTDIQNRQDIELLVRTFYNKVNEDALLSPVFNDFAKVNWEKHLPVMYDFWGSILFGEANYKGNPFLKHIPLPISKNHFERWLSLFVETIDENFAGEKAEEAKKRAASIAGIFQYKLEFIHANNPNTTH